MPQLLTAPKGLDGFTPFRDIPTGRPGWWRKIDGVEYYVMPTAGSLDVSPLTVLDADAYAALTGSVGDGVLMNEVRHQPAAITGNSEELKEIAGDPAPEASASASLPAVDRILKRHSLVDGSTFVTPALVLGLCILGAAILYMIGRLKSRE